MIRQTLKLADDWIDRHRPWSLLATVLATVATVALINWGTGSDLFRQFFYPKQCVPSSPKTCDPLEWKELFQATILVLGLPVAFMLWHWRDRNVRDQIDAQRKDINLQEFQEVQLRAVGIAGNETPNESKHILQVAALHQLRGFLKGDFGPAFKRPAFETYSALLSRSNALEWDAGDDDESYLPNEIFKAVRAIVYEDWKWFFWEDYDRKKGWPLSGRSFHHISLPVDADLTGLDLSRVNFYESHLNNVTFDEATCWEANFSKCSMRCSSLVMASFEEGKFDGADLAGAKAQGSDMSGTSLKGTKFHGASFARASFFKANGSDCEFVNVGLEESNFNDSHFVGVDFQNSRLKGSKFISARVIKGSIAGADIRNCDLSYAFLDGFFPQQAKSCEAVVINSKTRLPHPNVPADDELLSSERDEVILMWIEHGADLVDAEQDSSLADMSEKDQVIRERRARMDKIRASAFHTIIAKDD